MSFLIAFIVFGVLVFIHELGHMLLAKKNGVGVTEFSIGMGPRLFSFDKGGTKYSLKLIPFGGSCMMVGEMDESEAEDAFNNRSVWARISV
ncbi:MAG: site-2 protease family protein, partial [Lachnospiraceae bacterium]|nr:site-2 protease family protein [Lachnospiraceae bacterium]